MSESGSALVGFQKSKLFLFPVIGRHEIDHPFARDLETIMNNLIQENKLTRTDQEKKGQDLKNPTLAPTQSLFLLNFTPTILPFVRRTRLFTRRPFG